jgi:hypothetical protein
MTTIGHDTYQTGNVPELSSVAGMLSSLPMSLSLDQYYCHICHKLLDVCSFQQRGPLQPDLGGDSIVCVCVFVCVCVCGGGGGGGMCEGKRGGKKRREGRLGADRSIFPL